jgi:hypothetical protein
MTFAARAAALPLIAAALVPFGPVAAQDQPGDRVNMVIAYSEDECPEASEEGEIVICEILVEAERYRIPSNLRSSDSPQNRSWVRDVEKIRYIGAFGTMWCDPAGAGGFTGCTQQMIDAAYQDKQEGSKVRFAQLIEQARQERLAGIDASAEAEQSRVEEIEREYLERLERERNAPLPGEVDPALTPPEELAEPRIIPVPPSKPGPFDGDDEEQVPLDAAPPPGNPGS